MSADELYLRGDIVAEPLVSGWYAWTHLISPATLAMNVVGRHLKIMASFVHAPKVHVAAVKNPKMLGGPFIDYAESRVAEVQSLIEQTRSEQARLIAFAEGVHQLNALLKRAATGAGLDDLYAQVPDCLRGYVELFYDARHQPTFRLYESLLYRSAYYDRTAQSLQLHVTQNDHRPFVLSTPRLPDATSVCVQLPFESPVLDRFFRARYEPTLRAGWPTNWASRRKAGRCSVPSSPASRPRRASAIRASRRASASSAMPACCSRPARSRSSPIRS